jgi:hypothetical protein
MKMTVANIEKLRNLSIVSLVTLGAGTGVVLLIRHFYKKYAQNKSLNQSFNQGAAADYARQLKMAFENDNYLQWGTDRNAVFRTMNAIPSRALFASVVVQYHAMYNRNLLDDLKGELSTEDARKVEAILKSKG